MIHNSTRKKNGEAGLTAAQLLDYCNELDNRGADTSEDIEVYEASQDGTIYPFDPDRLYRDRHHERDEVRKSTTALLKTLTTWGPYLNQYTRN